MRILIIGDIVGRPGKHACSQIIPRLIREREIDCVVANAENAAAGSGLTPQMYAKLRHQGIDLVTMGDHIYKRLEIVHLLETDERIVKPANLPPESVGRDFAVATTRRGPKVAVISLLGRTYMNTRADCPFHAADRVLDQIPRDVKLIVVDMHAETTSEKVAMGWYLNGRVTAVVGTHTHIPTADERILPGGTAYITDLGMTGPYNSVLGRDKDRVLRSLVTGMPHPYDVAHDDVHLSGVLVEADSTSGRAVRIERVWVKDESSPAVFGADE
ncbi:MAG: TIGR00282 family metallophosphoesterase [Planctomycetes bacterium]|nr:TIGR00282 family metallophosphoesterase [Planctomycetota bacterium]